MPTETRTVSLTNPSLFDQATGLVTALRYLAELERQFHADVAGRATPDGHDPCYLSKIPRCGKIATSEGTWYGPCWLPEGHRFTCHGPENFGKSPSPPTVSGMTLARSP
ncbi:MAG: hypothetical protein KGI98_16980 [Euryarchaeota archaeon]|nr:hypothetical protein [Euryarchaeota archaeon]